MAAPVVTTMAQGERLLPQTEALHHSGQSTHEAWGHVARPFQIFKLGAS